MIRRRRGAAGPAPVLERLNPPALAELTAERAILHRHLVAAGIPVPELYGIAGRAGGWSAATGRPVTAAALPAFLEAEPPDAFAVAPSRAGAAPVRLLRRERGGFVDRDGLRLTPATLAAELLRDPGPELHLVQAWLRDHPELAAALAGDDLHPVRLTAFVAASGDVQVLHGALRLGPGGRWAEVDMPAGRGAGVRLPDWEEAVAVAYRVAVQLLPRRFTAVDVAVTPAGPVVVGADRGDRPLPLPRHGEVVRAVVRAEEDGRPVSVAVPA